MRVSKWMSPKVVTLQPSDSISTAIHLMKEKRIRRIPIVNGGGKLVGIVSDRDLKDVSPSRATTLDIWELHAVLDKLKIARHHDEEALHGHARTRRSRRPPRSCSRSASRVCPCSTRRARSSGS